METKMHPWQRELELLCGCSTKADFLLNYIKNVWTRLTKQQQQQKDCLKNQKAEDVMKGLYEHLLGLFECDSPYWTPGRMRFHLRTHNSNGLQLCPQLTLCNGSTAKHPSPERGKTSFYSSEKKSPDS